MFRLADDFEAEIKEAYLQSKLPAIPDKKAIDKLLFLNQQRLHDIGTGMWIAPLYAALSAVEMLTADYSDVESGATLTPMNIAVMGMALYLVFKKGQSGENEYGPDPLAK